MSNPSLAAIASIRSEVQDWTPTDSAIAATLNTPSIANPANGGVAPQVSKPFTVSDVFGTLSPASRSNLKDVAFIANVRDDINSQNRSACGLWAQLLAAGSVITPDEFTAIMGLLSATIPDPAYQAQISWAQSVIGRPVDAPDVAAARPPA